MNIIEEIFKNCTFNNNIARTFLSGYLTSGTEPRSMWGAYFTNSKVDIANCTFNNNTGFGEAPRHVSTGQGGAIYAEDSINNISTTH